MQEQGGGRLAAWLAAAGAPADTGARITRALGEQAADKIAQDPWCVLEVPGVTPQAADALARAALSADAASDGTGADSGAGDGTGAAVAAGAAAAGTGAETDPSDPRRTRALVGWLLRRGASQGSTVQGADVIAAALTKAGAADATGAIADAIENGVALAFAEPVRLSPDADEAEMEEFEQLDDEDDDNPAAMLTSARTLLALERWAFAEQSAAEAAQRIAATPQPVEPKEAPGDTEAGAETGSGAGAGAATGSGASSANPAKLLLDAVLANGLTLVTGAEAKDLAQLAAAFPNALLASPSPAGLRALAAAGAEPVDARVLSEQPERVGAADVVILADAQQLDVELTAVLLESVRDGAHVALAGDPAAPASRGPGLVLRDLLELDEPDFGGKLPRAEIKRRPTGPLTALLDAVRYGGLPPQELLRGPDGTSKEVVIVPVREAGEAVHRTVQLAAESIPRAFGLGGRDVQVVATAVGGPAGTGALNAALKARFNPGPGVCAGFDAGDRVVLAAPLPEHGLFGGETGVIGEAGREGLDLILDAPHGARTGLELKAVEAQVDTETQVDAEAEIETEEQDGAEAPAGTEAPGGETQSGGPIRLDAEQSAKVLRPAWALTIQEAQGGRWPAVIAVFDADSVPTLTRALAVGAIGAAEQHLSVVHGAGGALASAVEKIPDRPRHTRLRHAVRD